MANTTTAEYRTTPAVCAVDLDGEILVWDARTEQLHRLNAAASMVWRALSEWMTPVHLAEALGASPDTVAYDVADCVAQLEALDLLETRVTPTARTAL